MAISMARKGATIKPRFALAAVSVLALLLSACGGGGVSTVGSAGGGSGNSSGLPILNLGLVPTVDVAPIFVGIQQGFFANEGIQLVTKNADSGGTIITGVVQGSYDVGEAASSPAIVAASKKLPLTAVAGNSVVSATDRVNGVLVAKDSPIKSYADLAGKTVSVNSLGALFDLCLRAVLTKSGVNPGGLKIIELPFNQTAPSITKGQIDAGVLPEPFLTQALGDGTLRSIGSPCNDGLPAKAVQTLFFTSNQTAKNKADLIQRFVRGLKKADEFLQANPGEFAKILPSFTQLTPDVASKISQSTYATEIDRDAYNQLIAQMVNLGFIPSSQSVAGFVQ